MKITFALLLALLLLGGAVFAQPTVPPATPDPTSTPAPTVPPVTQTPTPTATLSATLAPTAVQGRADSRETTLKPAIVSRQNTYFSTHGRYFQGIAWGNIVPSDGSDAAPDLTRKPGYQLESWSDVFPGVFSATEPSRMRIDQYVGPQGAGWVLCMEVGAAVDQYERCENFGPETRRTSVVWVKAVPFPAATAQATLQARIGLGGR